MIGLSFIFSFSVALIFSLITFLLIFFDISFHQNVFHFIVGNPRITILQLVALLTSMPIAYIVSYKYHVKDWFFTMLETKVATDEAILASLNELIIVTDLKLHIISVNDTVERAMLKSRSELLYKPVFDEFLFKDKKGRFVTKETFFSEGNTSLQPKIINDVFTLFGSVTSDREVTIRVQKTKELESNMNQISFIISFTKRPITASMTTVLKKARMKYEAMNENLKKRLKEEKLYDIRTQIILLEKIESDIYNVNTAKEQLKTVHISKIDVTKLCKHAVILEHDFAHSFHVAIDFELCNFGVKDIAPLVTKGFSIKPEDWTGPFFTVACDMERVEIVIKKLLDMAVFLASTQKNPKILLQVERERKDTIVIKVVGDCPVINNTDIAEIFKPYYGALYEKSNLHLGSGLEGYLVKTICDILAIPINVNVAQNNLTLPKITFSLPIKKLPSKNSVLFSPR